MPFCTMGDQLALLIAQNHDVTDEFGSFSAPGVRAMAEAAIAPEDLLARATCSEGGTCSG